MTRSALSLKRFPLACVVALGGMGSLPAHAGAVAVPTISTVYFVGGCSDCTLQTAPLIGTLNLADYSFGDQIQASNFFSFNYNGSNLVDPYEVVNIAYAPVVAEGGDLGLHAVASQYIFGINGSDRVAGAITPDQGPSRFDLVFDDGIRFESIADGRWYTCAPGPSGYYSGSCNITFNNDTGSGQWSVSAVPEPGSLALMALGGLVVAGLARRQARRPD